MISWGKLSLEAIDLQVYLKKRQHYTAEEFSIDASWVYEMIARLRNGVNEWVEEYDCPGNLLILYYEGFALADLDVMSFVWR